MKFRFTNPPYHAFESQAFILPVSRRNFYIFDCGARHNGQVPPVHSPDFRTFDALEALC